MYIYYIYINYIYIFIYIYSTRFLLLFLLDSRSHCRMSLRRGQASLARCGAVIGESGLVSNLMGMVVPMS